MTDQPRTARIERLEAVARLAAEGWDRWEKMGEQQDEYYKNKKPLPSWPRDAFEGYLDALKQAAEEALKP